MLFFITQGCIPRCYGVDVSVGGVFLSLFYATVSPCILLLSLQFIENNWGISLFLKQWFCLKKRQSIQMASEGIFQKVLCNYSVNCFWSFPHLTLPTLQFCLAGQAHLNPNLAPVAPFPGMGFRMHKGRLVLLSPTHPWRRMVERAGRAFSLELLTGWPLEIEPKSLSFRKLVGMYEVRREEVGADVWMSVVGFGYIISGQKWNTESCLGSFSVPRLCTVLTLSYNMD